MDAEYFTRSLNVRVVRDVPVNGYWGSYEHHTRTITIHPDLSPIQERYALYHEITHAYYGDVECKPEWERRADIGAAKALIRICDLRRAAMMHDTIEAVACELEVHPHLVRVYHKYLGGFR